MKPKTQFSRLWNIWVLLDFSPSLPPLEAVIDTSPSPQQILFSQNIKSLPEYQLKVHDVEGIHHETYLLANKGEFARIAADPLGNDQLNLFCYEVIFVLWHQILCQYLSCLFVGCEALSVSVLVLGGSEAGPGQYWLRGVHRTQRHLRSGPGQGVRVRMVLQQNALEEQRVQSEFFSSPLYCCVTGVLWLGESIRGCVCGCADQGGIHHQSPVATRQLLDALHHRDGPHHVLHGAQIVQEHVLPLHHRHQCRPAHVREGSI